MYLYDPKAIAQNDRLKADKQELGMDKDEPFNLGADPDLEPDKLPKQAVDTFLTGYYIIEDIKYTYSKSSPKPTENTKQVVTLLRREWPTRTENLINPPGLAEDATPEEKAEVIAENSPPPPPPESTPAPTSTPEPTPEPTPEEPLDIQITVPAQTSTQDVTQVFASHNTYPKFTGSWSANRELVEFEYFEAEIDGTLLTPGNGLSMKKNGTWVVDFANVGAIDSGTYTLEVYIEAEGKKFEASGQVTVIDQS